MDALRVAVVLDREGPRIGGLRFVAALAAAFVCGARRFACASTSSGATFFDEKQQNIERVT